MIQGHWDVVVIGSGFGGSMAALRMAQAGLRVLILERGRWVDRDSSAWDPRTILVDRKYRSTSPCLAQEDRGLQTLYPNEAVGGNSVFYGAASFRLRWQDFELGSLFDGKPDPLRYVDWPIRYLDLEPYYSEAEELLGVAGQEGSDPTEPPRGHPYPQKAPSYGFMARRVARAAEELGLRPFPIPLAINFHRTGPRRQCIQCTTCDLFPCKIGAKNDLAVTVLPEALRHGAVVRGQTVARRLHVNGGRVRSVECVDTRTGEAFTVSCDLCVVGCGAIGSAQLLLNSGLGQREPNGKWIGRHLMRHCSGIIIGVFPFDTNPERKFHKQVAITDFYFGHPDRRPPHGPWGMIQALQVAPPEFIQAEILFPFGLVAARSVRHHIYLICIAEDLANPENRVEIDPTRKDDYGVPIARITHHYTRRDLEAREGLQREASRILTQAGSFLQFRKAIRTFSHALGTCRFGHDPDHAVLDPWCGFFGVKNLFVVDGGFMPTSGGVNPSLTIAANGLRVGKYIARNWDHLVREAAVRGTAVSAG